jgi:hypothetical protein
MIRLPGAGDLNAGPGSAGPSIQIAHHMTKGRSARRTETGEQPPDPTAARWEGLAIVVACPLARMR